MSTWLARVLTREPGYEGEVVARYSQRLLAFARQQLPACVRGRVDPEDVVQSVYRSFFQRLNDDRFAFQESHDLWRLLAAMTFHKARNTVRFHQRERRDVRRDKPILTEEDVAQCGERTPDSKDLNLLVSCLEDLLRGLPDSRREIVVRRLDGKSVEEIARKVGCSRHTVYRVLSHMQQVSARQLEASS